MGPASLWLATTLGVVFNVSLGGPPGGEVRADVPESWAFSDQSFVSLGYRLTCATFHNCAPEEIRVVAMVESIRVEPMRIPPSAPVDSLEQFQTVGRYGTTSSFGENAFEAQLKPGAVYLDLAFHGNLPPSHYLWAEERSPEVRLAAFATSRVPRWDTKYSVGFGTTFNIWGYPWSVYLVARKPYRASDLEDAFAIVRSIAFSDKPVLNERHAIETATPFLPANLRPLDEWEQASHAWLHYEVVSDREGDAFYVEFRTLDGTVDRAITQRRAYLVGRDATVVEVASKP